MQRTAFLFPGQGSQRVGMGVDIATQRPDLVSPYYRTAEQVLAMPLARLCWDGPPEALAATSVTQPAIFINSLIGLELLRDQGVQPDLAAGHSLGEYAALVCAGVLEWTDALRLVGERGRLMELVNARTPGRMVAVLGLGLEALEQVCIRAAAETGQTVEVANDNEPNQIVVSGHVAAVAAAAAGAMAAGARRIVPLEVGAPFHCSLMKDIEDEFAEALAKVTLRDPEIPVFSSVTAARIRDGRDAAECLRRQITSRVRWTQTVAGLTEAGATRFVEVGPGRALSGLCRRIVPDARAYPTGDWNTFNRTVAALALERVSVRTF